jgi:soluble lytic murein transglycosylase-like protein
MDLNMEPLNMDRIALSSLIAIGLAVASCQPLEWELADPAQLPHVGLEPPESDPIPFDEASEAGIETRLSDAEVLEAYLIRQHTGLSKSEIRVLADVVISEAARHGLDSGLVLAVMHVESSCYHRAVSPVGALGLMQVMPATGEALAREHGIEWYGPETLFDPVVNVKLGIAYLKELSDRYQQLPAALAAYNWGPGHIDRRLRRGSQLPERYVKSVMRAYSNVGDDLAMRRVASS